MSMEFDDVTTQGCDSVQLEEDTSCGEKVPEPNDEENGDTDLRPVHIGWLSEQLRVERAELERRHEQLLEQLMHRMTNPLTSFGSHPEADLNESLILKGVESTTSSYHSASHLPSTPLDRKLPESQSTPPMPSHPRPGGHAPPPMSSAPVDLCIEQRPTSESETMPIPRLPGASSVESMETLECQNEVKKLERLESGTSVKTKNATNASRKTQLSWADVVPAQPNSQRKTNRVSAEDCQTAYDSKKSPKITIQVPEVDGARTQRFSAAGLLFNDAARAMRAVEGSQSGEDQNIDRGSSKKSIILKTRRARCQKAFDARIKSPIFEVVFAIAIMLNAIMMALQQQTTGMWNGSSIRFPGYVWASEDNFWPWADDFFNVMEKMFTICFAIELILRVAAYRKRVFMSAWNYLDFIVVTLALVAWSDNGNVAVNPTIIRLARFGKLARIVRIMQHAAILESLKLIMASIQASVSTLFWSLCVLGIIQSIAGMLLGQLLSDFIVDDANDLNIRQRVFAYYGTFWRSAITMFEIIFANWAPTCRLLLDEVDEGYGIFFIVYRCVIGFAVLSVIQAVFIQQTMKSAKVGDDVILAQKRREQEKYSKRLKEVFDQLDESGDGYISWEEFAPILEDRNLQAMLNALEINIDDVQNLFNILDDGDGMISSDEFVQGVTSIRGQAKAVDMITVLNIAKRVESKMDTVVRLESLLTSVLPSTTPHRNAEVKNGTAARSRWKGVKKMTLAMNVSRVGKPQPKPEAAENPD